ncbi:MAG TPA: transporter substrate-binding domain-containing protein [Gammaproteobacteria bacterium]|nr:transporter substrate-binding domain-containing protein [Gammaproteobacteria bacterium]
MSWRLVFCAAGLALSSTVPQVVYAQQQACAALVAVSYIDPALAGEAPAEGKQLEHFNAELIQALGQATQLAIKLESSQGRKALAEVRSGRVDLIIGVSSAPEHDAQLDYLEPAYLQKNYRLWRRAGEQLSLKRWPELSGLRGVQVVPTTELTDFAVQAELLNWPVRTVQTLDAAVDKVIDGRADYLLAEQQELLEHLEQHSLAQDFEFIEPVVESQELYVALAKDSVCNTAALRSRLSKALVELSQ